MGKFILGLIVGALTILIALELSKPVIDLPEEYRAITHDPNHKDLMTAYYDKDNKLVLGFFYDPADHGENRIIKQTIDERGLYSVLFIQDGKEYGLDYITSEQMDSLVYELNH